MSSDDRAPSLEAVANRFKRVAELEFHNASPLYEGFSLHIAEDPEMLGLAAHARRGQPLPNLFFAAIHFLLLRRVEYPLASFYPSVTAIASHAAGETAYRSFRSFCLRHREEIQGIISTRIVQTNEVQRCACLLPAFALASQKAGGRPLALIEIGASAGLNLLWDRYGYDYGDGFRCGNANSPVQLACTLRGDNRPAIPDSLPKISFRLGLDLNPIDVCDPEATLWLRALVWPDEVDRGVLLQRAIELAQKASPPLMAGDALDLLPNVFKTVPKDEILCVFHTHTVNQFPQEAREHLSSLLAEQAKQRDLFRVSIEWGRGRRYPQLELVSFEHGLSKEKLLAHCDAHGEWLEWFYKD